MWGCGNNQAIFNPNMIKTYPSGDNLASVPMRVGSDTDWVAISSGGRDLGYKFGAGNFVFGLKANGTLWGWGENSTGALGRGIKDDVTGLTAFQLSGPGNTGNWVNVSCGSEHVVAIKSNGSLWSWGYNTFGQLGNGNKNPSSRPTQVGVDTNWAKVSSGRRSTIAIKTNGTMWAWGRNNQGQLATNNITDVSVPIQIGSGTTGDWQEISLTQEHALAIKNNGTLWAWGRNTWGQLGLGDTATRSSPVQVGSGTTGPWLKISAGLNSSHGLKMDGTLWAWGRNNQGQLGIGTTASCSSPVQVQIGSSDWSDVSIGSLYRNSVVDFSHVIATKGNGRIFAWGDNRYGKLGTISNPTFVEFPVLLPGTNNDWNLVSSSVHSMAIKNNGTLWAWGRNPYGALGLGFSEAVLFGVNSPTQVGSGATGDWSIVKSSGSSIALNTFAIKTNGTLWAWGRNSEGQLGLNNTTSRSSPVQIGADTDWKFVEGANGLGAATIKTNGTLWAWGKNDYGQLGIGTTADQSSPVQIGSGATGPWSSIRSSNRVSLAIKEDGSLWGWGDNRTSQLGILPVRSRSSPVQVGSGTTGPWIETSNGGGVTIALSSSGTLWGFGNSKSLIGVNNISYSPVQIGGSGITGPWSRISVGYNHAMAVRTNGTLWAWGFNTFGQLGRSPIGSTISTPVQVGSGTTGPWSKVVASTNASFGLRQNGTLWSWGRNGSYGFLGRNISTDTSFSSPVQIGSGTTGPWTNVNASNRGGYHALASQTGGTLWTWGRNTWGQLGLGDTAARSSPVQIGSGTTGPWIAFSAGQSHSLGIRTDGTLWAWGRNDYGQLGIGTTADQSSPVQIGSGATGPWSVVNAGYSNSFALTTDGRMWAWGRNFASIYSNSLTGTHGYLGINTNQGHRSSPVQIGSLNSWSSVSTDFRHTTALKTDGTLWAWGRLSNNLIVRASYLYVSSPIQVGTDNNWRDARPSGGNNAGIAIGLKQNGTLWGWGWVVGGGLPGLTAPVGGYGNIISPTRIGAESDWQKMVGTTMLLKTDNTMWGWGNNRYGRLGNGSFSYVAAEVFNQSSITQVLSGGDWKDGSIGSVATGIKNDGSLWSWGARRTYPTVDLSGVNVPSYVVQPTQISSRINKTTGILSTPMGGRNSFFIR